MKKYLFLSAFLICLINLSTNGQVDLRYRYQQKVEKFNRMKTTGTILTFAGIGTTIVGTVIFVNGIEQYDSYDYGNSYSDYNEGELAIYGGAILMELGIDMVVAGIVVNSIGRRKSRQYNNMLQNLSMGINYRPENKGLSLVYRF